MLTIFVGPTKQTIITVDQKPAEVFPTFVPTESGELQSFHARTDYSKIEDVGFFVPCKFLSTYWFRVPYLPPRLKRTVIRFLRELHAKQDLSYDCYSFVCEANGLDGSGGSATLLNIWRLRPLRRWVSVGNVVFLTSGEGNDIRFHHAAVYIGHKRYISVWGAGGDLEIATLPDMMKGYEANRAVLALPRTAAD